MHWFSHECYYIISQLASFQGSLWPSGHVAIAHLVKYPLLFIVQLLFLEAKMKGQVSSILKTSTTSL